MKWRLYIGVLVILLCASDPTFAASSSKAEIQQRLEEKRAIHRELLNKENKLSSEVSSLAKNLVAASEELRSLETSLSASDKKIEKLQSEREAYLEQMYKDYEAIGTLAVAAQRFKTASNAEIILQQNPINAARLSLIMKSMIPELDKRSSALKKRVEDIEKVENDIEIQKDLKSKQLIKFNEKQDDLSKLLKERKQLYEKTSADRKAEETEVAKLAKEAKNLEDLVSKIEPKTKKARGASGFKMPANALLPVHGVIVTGFGENDDLGARSKGIIFKVSSGSTVVTPLAGVVKFAGPFQKYKEILIIQHDGGYHSLIAGLGRVDTVVGARLNAGEPVGTTDATSVDPTVYYELRQDGEPVNPQQLLAAQQRKKKKS